MQYSSCAVGRAGRRSPSSALRTPCESHRDCSLTADRPYARCCRPTRKWASIAAVLCSHATSTIIKTDQGAAIRLIESLSSPFREFSVHLDENFLKSKYVVAPQLGRVS
uniref:Uncharacterized protein n=1 Tax=Plectus sambesii TaxID=2011161 RepID=A0A914VII7_9BILA